MKRLGIFILVFFAVIVVFGQVPIKDSLRIQQISGINFRDISEEHIKYILERDTTVSVTHKSRKDPGSNQPAYYINGLFVNNLSISTINPATIEEITVEAGEFEKHNKKYTGKLFIKLKDGIEFKPIPFNELKKKYLDLPFEGSIVMIDNNILYDDYNALVINERGIYKIEVQTLPIENENLNLNVINLITRTEKNIRESESIRIRGDKNE